VDAVANIAISSYRNGLISPVLAEEILAEYLLSEVITKIYWTKDGAKIVRPTRAYPMLTEIRLSAKEINITNN
jgi:hypothetical protein